MVLNEPTSFVSLGYMLGLHAPGKKGIGNFLPVAHHANLVQGAAGRILRQLCPQAEIGTTNYFSSVQPRNPQSSWDVAAAKRFDAVINRLYVDPIVGRGYPTDVFPLLRRIEKYFQPNDEQLLPFDFDFLGLQTYSRDVIKWTLFQPIIWGTIIPPEKRGVTERTAMGWEVYPEGIYELLKRFGSYPEIKKIYVTENGTAFPDPEPHQNRVPDPKRTAYLQQHIQSVYRAKQEGVPVEGYFVWSFMDNFEWHEGFRPRFGLVYLDYATQDRYVKDS
jgi:beta-glucosidase